MGHQLGQLSGHFSHRRNFALFNIVGRTAFGARRNLRKAGDLLFLAPRRFRQRVVMEKTGIRGNGEPQLRRRIHRADD